MIIIVPSGPSYEKQLKKKKKTSFLHYLVNWKETAVPKMNLISKVAHLGSVCSFTNTALCRCSFLFFNSVSLSVKYVKENSFKPWRETEFSDTSKAFTDLWVRRVKCKAWSRIWVVIKHDSMKCLWMPRDVSWHFVDGSQKKYIMPCSDSSVSTSMRDSEWEVIGRDSVACALQEVGLDGHKGPLSPSSCRNIFPLGAGECELFVYP